MNAYRIETIVAEGGRLELGDLPFAPGATVEVIVLESGASSPDGAPFPLRGLVGEYHDPFEPAVEIEAWDALR